MISTTNIEEIIFSPLQRVHKKVVHFKGFLYYLYLDKEQGH
jgi:hypothetical protein